ncbi:MAG: hypothetical protein H7Y38_15500 [Armatimonadetes bacterium]|nr:hypothetical protein [Armatimonadota bacterium]
MKLKTVLITGGVLVAAGLGYFGWRESRSQWIDAGYVGILYNATGGVQQKVLQPQRVVVGFRQRLYTYPTKLQSAKYVQATDEGEVKAADGILITTSENANTTFDVCVVYRVLPENALKVFGAFGPVDVQTIQSTHIRRAVKDVVNEVGPRYDVFELMGEKRGDFSAAATESLRKRMEPKGITVDSVMLMTAYPAVETKDKINRRINQYTEYEIALLRGQIAEVSRKTNVVIANAQNDATRITSATAKDQGLSQLRLQADGEAIEKWDGHLPEIRSGAGQTLVLDGGAMTARRAATVANTQGQKQ